MFQRRISHRSVGEKVTIKATAFDASANGHRRFVGALIGEQTCTGKKPAWFWINPKGAWRPGLFVNVEVVSEETAACDDLADAVQNVGRKAGGLLKVNGGFIAQPVKLGRSDGKRVEVLGASKPVCPYASTGSFVVKSELGKDLPNTRTDPGAHTCLKTHSILHRAAMAGAAGGVGQWRPSASSATKSCLSTRSPTSRTSRFRSTPGGRLLAFGDRAAGYIPD